MGLSSLPGWVRLSIPPIPIASKGRGKQRRYRQRAPIVSHKDRYVCWVVTSGGVSQMRDRPQSQTALGAVLKGPVGAPEQYSHITASEAVQNFPRTGRFPRELCGICPALQSSRLGRAKLGHRGGVAQGSGYKYFSRRATWPGAPAIRSSPIRHMGRRASPCPGCVVCGAPMGP